MPCVVYAWASSMAVNISLSLNSAQSGLRGITGNMKFRADGTGCVLQACPFQMNA